MWEGRLWHTLDTELGAAEVLRRAYQNLESTSAEKGISRTIFATSAGVLMKVQMSLLFSEKNHNRKLSSIFTPILLDTLRE